MSTPVIKVEHLTKAFRIGVKEEVPDNLMSAFKGLVMAPWRNFNRLRRLNTASDLPFADRDSSIDSDTLWALKDVSFDVYKGEVVGIIGRNGAGKSTLLKILSRITEPTSGRAVIRGRMSSLLEVGTGFHPDLSGRENVYMNGTILGMTKREIDRKFDEIVDFSGIEKFLDTPTKRYSSGMQVRLAFAVAAHLEPEILVIDEVLAVGDAEFQRKCMGKMQNIATQGRTVLFVSHNMDAVSKLCGRSVHIERGQISGIGPSKSIVYKYLAASFRDSNHSLPESERPGSGCFRITNVSVGNESLSDAEVYVGGAETKVIRFRVEQRKPSADTACVTAHLVNENGLEIAICDSRFLNQTFTEIQIPLDVSLVLKTPWLKPGDYRVDLSVRSQGLVDLYEGAAVIHVLPNIPYEFSAPPEILARGVVFPDFEFVMKTVSQSSMHG